MQSVFRDSEDPGTFLELIGEGAFGRVDKVSVNGAIRARKRLTHLEDDNVSRFQREIDILSLMTSPYVVSIYGKGESHFGEQQLFPYYHMEFAETTFEKYIQYLDWTANHVDILSRLWEVSLGVAHFHSHNVVHRDLKPANILIQQNSSRVCDFGLGKNNNAVNSLQTAVGTRGGTQSYMPPEQYVAFENAGTSADVYSFGATMYRAVTGAVPVMAPDLALHVRSWGTPYSTFIARCLEWDSSSRYSDGIEMSNELTALILNEMKQGRSGLTIDFSRALNSLSFFFDKGGEAFFEAFKEIFYQCPDELKRDLWTHFSSRGIKATLESSHYNSFIDMMYSYDSDIVQKNTSFTYVDSVGKFYTRFAEVVFRQIMEVGSFPSAPLQTRRVLDLTVSLSKTLIQQSAELNRFEGGRDFIRIFADGGGERVTALKAVLDRVDDRTKDWLKDGFDYSLISVDPGVRAIIS